MNAMALIAPGAFLWLTFYIQATTGATAPGMWLGIVLALLLCLATAVCYAEMAKLYPGTGSSYYFAEQSFLNHDKAWSYARLSKFIVGWGSHLYYWIYPGVMVGVMGILCGYLVGTIWPNFMSASNPGPVFMMVVAVVFSFAMAYIAYRGVNGSTSVNIAINVIQISALLVFSVMALGYRMNHPPGSVAYQFDSTSGAAYTYEFATTRPWCDGKVTDTIVRDADGVPQPKLDAAGKPVPYHISYPDKDDKGNFLIASRRPIRWLASHNFGWVFVQATVAILILVGFESVTAMGGEAKNAKRDVPIAVITSLLVQGAFCYLIEYFAANYFLNSGYTMQSASGSAAPIGDMMIIVGDALFGAGQRPHLHAGRSLHGVPGDHRHDALLHEHRRARHLCHGQGRRSARALRPAARQEPDAAPRHLDAGHHLGRGRLHRGCRWRSAMPALRPMRPSRRCRTASGPALATPPTTRWRRCPIRC